MRTPLARPGRRAGIGGWHLRTALGAQAPDRPRAWPETFLFPLRYRLLRRVRLDIVFVARRGKMGHRDHYATLGLPRGAEHSLIQTTYWRLARQCNTALTSDPQAPRLLRDLNEAYEVLSTPQLRRQYDELLARAGLAPEASPRPRWRL